MLILIFLVQLYPIPHIFTGALFKSEAERVGGMDFQPAEIEVSFKPMSCQTLV